MLGSGQISAVLMRPEATRAPARTAGDIVTRAKDCKILRGLASTALPTRADRPSESGRPYDLRGTESNMEGDTQQTSPWEPSAQDLADAHRSLNKKTRCGLWSRAPASHRTDDSD